MELAVDEKEALEFLYAYMPLGDMVNMSQEYWLENYRMTREAMKTMPWGGIVPERELRHFVLPVRVNNENLDTSRAVFFGELAPRVKNLSMYDAVLEVNHWCHEKAVYQPTDSRTCSPLSISSFNAFFCFQIDCLLKHIYRLFQYIAGLLPRPDISGFAL